MALYLDIAQGEEVTVGEGPDQVTISISPEDRQQVDIRIGSILCGIRLKGRRMKLKLGADRSIPIRHKK